MRGVRELRYIGMCVPGAWSAGLGSTAAREHGGKPLEEEEGSAPTAPTAPTAPPALTAL